MVPILKLSSLSRANLRVTAELESHGFWSELLAQVHVLLVPFSWSCYGWQWYGGDGSICVPAVSIARLGDVVFRRPRMGLRDVLRHEWAHAIADNHRGLVRSRRFSDAFGGNHNGAKSVYFDPTKHVSGYSATHPSEDFAEVFALFLKHSAVLPARFSTPPIRDRWNFVRDLGAAISVGKKKW